MSYVAAKFIFEDTRLAIRYNTFIQKNRHAILVPSLISFMFRFLEHLGEL